MFYIKNSKLILKKTIQFFVIPLIMFCITSINENGYDCISKLYYWRLWIVWPILTPADTFLCSIKVFYILFYSGSILKFSIQVKGKTIFFSKWLNFILKIQFSKWNISQSGKKWQESLMVLFKVLIKDNINCYDRMFNPLLPETVLVDYKSVLVVSIWKIK